MNREKQKEIVRMFKNRWGRFRASSKYIEDFKIPYHLIAPELTGKEKCSIFQIEQGYFF